MRERVKSAEMKEEYRCKNGGRNGGGKENKNCRNEKMVKKKGKRRENEDGTYD